MKYLILLLLLVGCKAKVSEDGLNVIDFQKVCIEGNIYFYAYGGQHGGSFGAIKLDQYGKPIKCSMELLKE